MSKGKVKRPKFIKKIVKDTGCLFCGSHENCTFHHKDPDTKISDIYTMVKNKTPKNIILKELSKCIVLCDKCHTKIHQSTSIRFLTKFKLKCLFNEYKAKIKNNFPEFYFRFYHIVTVLM